ncbi:CbiX/SirB N-terminal domain-containing protein [Halobaculum sp. D14]|uniref:CbiX/SirB N-terminal domain-containing protein n=1 Tax=Halobaculum sp. D14 TaxID=3421642 RepID=UPI003EBF155F
MTRDALVLLSRDTPHARETLPTHADRLARRGSVDEIHTCYYGHEAQYDLRDQLADVRADRVFAVPMVAAHDRQTTVDVPAALDRIDAAVHYGEPVGRSPAVTAALRDRAEEASTTEPQALALVALGSSSQPYHRQVAEYHAGRLRGHGAYGEVTTSYVVQNPAVECLRYNVDADRAVVLPLFVVGSQATSDDIPDRLELDRGNLDYAAPLGDHPQLTNAAAAELAKQRVLAENGAAADTFEQSLTADAAAVATDGRGDEHL